MKLALLIGLTLDKQSGKALTELAPFDQTLQKFKAMVNRGEAPSDKYPVVQLWTTSGLGKSHQFKPSQLPATKGKGGKVKSEDKSAAANAAKQLREKASSLATAAYAATAAADAAKGTDEEEALIKAAIKADAAAKAAGIAADEAEAAIK